MRDHTTCSRKFFIDSESSYAKAVLHSGLIDRIHFGLYHPEGGTLGELCISWTKMDGELVPQLQAFDDSWHALATFGDVLQRLAELDGTQPTPTKISAMLLECGFSDVTQRANSR